MRAAMEKQKAAAAIQRESIRKQAESLDLRLVVGPEVHATAGAEPVELASEAAAQAPCDPIADDVVTPIIDAAAKAQDVDVKLIRAVIEQESGFRPCAVSSKGARGLMQLMPETAQELGVKDSFDPKENIEGGSKYLKQLLYKYNGDVAQALGAYNAGPTAVDQAGGIPNIPETRDYVKAILQKLGITRTDPPSIQTPKPIEN